VDSGRQAGSRSLTSLQQRLVKAGGRLLIKVSIVFRNRARGVSKALGAGDFAQFRRDAEADGLSLKRAAPLNPSRLGGEE